jgi:hypothetical protein
MANSFFMDNAMRKKLAINGRYLSCPNIQPVCFFRRTVFLNLRRRRGNIPSFFIMTSFSICLPFVICSFSNVSNAAQNEFYSWNPCTPFTYPSNNSACDGVAVSTPYFVSCLPYIKKFYSWNPCTPFTYPSNNSACDGVAVSTPYFVTCIMSCLPYNNLNNSQYYLWNPYIPFTTRLVTVLL